MAAQKGNTLIVLKGNAASPEVFTAIAGMRSKTVRVGGEPIDVTTDDDVSSGVSWRTFISGIVDFEISASGVAKTVATLQSIISDSLAGTVANYQVTLTNFGTFEGPMILTSTELTGEYTDAVQFSTTIKANAAITWTPV